MLLPFGRYSLTKLLSKSVSMFLRPASTA
jgi:hypothetical protein